jgi:4'-phosphopantetheinyl transferase
LITLAENDVHLWQAELDRLSAHVQRLEHTLAPDELARANRFHFPQDRARFVVTRGALREILGQYLGLTPEQVRFGYGPVGKPVLAVGGGAGERESGRAGEQGNGGAGERGNGGVEVSLEFNLAHSGRLALFAVARGRRVGVDVEQIRPNVACEKLAVRFFAPEEQAQLLALPADLRIEAFFACWTRKEAFVKARGEGLALGLDQFAVSVAPGEPAVLLRAAFDPDEASRWTILALSPAPGYTAALAVEGHGWRLTCRQWPEETPINIVYPQFDKVEFESKIIQP